jgi:TonB family protein
MEEALVYRKTRRGTTELAATHGALSPPSRRVLILLDGQRTLAEIAELFGAESVEHIVSELQAQGLVRLVDPNEASTTTQSVPPVVYTRPQPVLDQAQPRGRGLGWALALLVIAGAIGGGYWDTVRTRRAAETAVDAAAAQAEQRPAITLASAERSDSTDVDPQQPASDAPQGFREVALSGLPAVTVTVTPTSAVMRAAPATDVRASLVADERASGAADAAAQGRRPAERPAPAVPLSALQPKLAPEPAPSDPGSSAAVSSPIAAPRAVPVSVAAADPVRPERTAIDLPPVMPAPSTAGAPPAEAALLPSAAPAAGKPAQTGSAAAGASPPEALGEQVAALAPSVPPKSGPVQLHPRRHDPPEYPPRALRARIGEGHVLARVWVTAEGSVEQVDIVKSTPARVFDDEVKRALSTWTFDPPGRQVDTTIELDFKP